MVLYNKGKTKITKDGKRLTSILEIDFEDGLTIYAFPGSLSPNDVLIKFKNKNIPRTQIRQPKHIHWATDILIKKDNNPKLTDKFLTFMLGRWNSIKPLKNRKYQTILNNLRTSKDKKFIKQFKKLNRHGFFTIEFIVHLIEILMLQEKTNNPDAYMFRDVVDKILNSEDLYVIISKATHNRR